MRYKSILLLLSAAALAILPSCHKKNEDTESDPYLEGTVSFSIPSFVKVGDELTVTPKGAVNPTTGNVGYYWFSSWNTARDTVKTENGSGDGSWTLTLPLATGTYTVTVGAFATDYINITTYKQFTVVDPSLEGSLKGMGYDSGSSMVDPRDNGVYYLTTAGDKVWMRNNLYYSGSGVSYEHSEAMDPIVGRLYNWNEAISACPEGWRLPTDEEFAAMTGASGDVLSGVAGSIMADGSFNGDKLWTFWPDVKITNTTKFSAVPIGYAIDQEGNMKYMGSGEYAAFWTADESGEESAKYRYIYVSKSDIFAGHGEKDSFRASVRCVKDSGE
ncbi:MAG: hypothetical protein IJ840_05355 [Bacteroidales bacterium]|nr:hypothetical protein [Bacteroidales bacterium]